MHLACHLFVRIYCNLAVCTCGTVFAGTGRQLRMRLTQKKLHSMYSSRHKEVPLTREPVPTCATRCPTCLTVQRYLPTLRMLTGFEGSEASGVTGMLK